MVATIPMVMYAAVGRKENKRKRRKGEVDFLYLIVAPTLFYYIFKS